MALDYSVGNGDYEFEFTGLDAAYAALVVLEEASEEALVACLTEAGMFGVFHAKLFAPVRYGVLRASIGEFTPGDVQAGADPALVAEAAAGAHFEAPTVPGPGSNRVYEVSWGSRLRYAGPVNYVHPTQSLFMERSLQETVTFLPVLVDQYLEAISQDHG